MTSQKEYIITEKQVRDIVASLADEYDTDELRCVAFDTIKEVRSRPYKSDAVLDELEKDILEVKKDLNLQLPCKTAKDLTITLALIGELQWVLVRIAELRQQKER